MENYSLNLCQYWSLPAASGIEEVSGRLMAALSTDYQPEAMKLQLARDRSLAELLAAPERLPFLRELEDLYLRDLSWVEARLGRPNVLDSVGEPWMILGDLIVFAAASPSRDEVSQAVYRLLKEKELL
jgi:hypothetical protein